MFQAWRPKKLLAGRAARGRGAEPAAATRARTAATAAARLRRLTRLSCPGPARGGRPPPTPASGDRQQREHHRQPGARAQERVRGRAGTLWRRRRSRRSGAPRATLPGRGPCLHRERPAAGRWPRGATAGPRRCRAAGRGRPARGSLCGAGLGDRHRAPCRRRRRAGSRCTGPPRSPGGRSPWAAATDGTASRAEARQARRRQRGATAPRPIIAPMQMSTPRVRGDGWFWAADIVLQVSTSR